MLENKIWGMCPGPVTTRCGPFLYLSVDIQRQSIPADHHLKMMMTSCESLSVNKTLAFSIKCSLKWNLRKSMLIPNIFRHPYPKHLNQGSWKVSLVCKGSFNTRHNYHKLTFQILLTNAKPWIVIWIIAALSAKWEKNLQARWYHSIL